MTIIADIVQTDAPKNILVIPVLTDVVAKFAARMNALKPMLIQLIAASASIAVILVKYAAAVFVAMNAKSAAKFV